ncbi:MAG: hypothetical protein WBZ14_00080, partial [Terriglobales bacterium]
MIGRKIAASTLTVAQCSVLLLVLLAVAALASAQNQKTAGASASRGSAPSKPATSTPHAAPAQRPSGSPS